MIGHIPREISSHVYFFIKKEEGWITGKVLSLKYQTSPMPSGGMEIPLVLKFNFCKSITFLKMKQFVNELCDYEFTRKFKIEESGDEKEIPTMVIYEDQDSVYVKTEEKMEDVSKPLASYEINDEEEIDKIAV